jgi:hypothetical protein
MKRFIFFYLPTSCDVTRMMEPHGPADMDMEVKYPDFPFRPSILMKTPIK